MMPLASLSRRALVAAAAAVAAMAPEVSEVSARKAPQAFVMATLFFPFADSTSTFGANFDAAYTHPASGSFGDFSGGVSVDSQVGSDQLRKQVIAELQEKTAEQLASEGATVAADRIAVTVV